MIRNFDTLKGQLSELATIINKFKSESVQLRLVELIFEHDSENLGETEKEEEDGTRRRGRRAGKKTEVKAETKKVKAKPSKKAKTGTTRKVGPTAILTQLINEEYFKSKRTIGDMISYCTSQKVRSFKANELSTPLARFVRDGRLKRSKNADGQYQYYKG